MKQTSQSRSFGRNVKKNVKSCDLSVSDDDHILTRIGGHTAAWARAPLYATGIVEGLGSSMGRVSELGMRGSQVTCKFIQRFVANEGTWRHIQHAVIRVEFLDGRAALRRVTLSKNFLKVTEQ
jgi:hypothetical protein